MIEIDRREPTPHEDGQPVHDLLGIGFGPANLALAALIEEELERGEEAPLTCLFLERRERFAWHPDMLIDGTRIQLSFLKDLVTLRNPQSRFSFLCYLAERGRLEDFVNLREFFPTRQEFNDYYCWVAAQVSHMVRFSRHVERIEPVIATSGEVVGVRVTALRPDGSTETHLGRDLVVAPGGVPYIPAGIEIDGQRVFHCREFLGTVTENYPDRDAPLHFIVVGSGQSAAEIFQYLYTHYPKARVTAAFRRYAYKPADESQFVNEIFHPGAVDFLFGLPEALRTQVIDAHYDTNYSAVDLGLIREIYSDLYERRVQGDDRVRVRKLHELLDVTPRGDSVVARFHDLALDRKVEMEADAVVLATGYQRDAQPPLLETLSPFLLTTAGGSYTVDRDYRIQTVPGFLPKVFLQGFTESTHGLSDTLLSVLPRRAREILDAVLRNGDTACRQGESEAGITLSLAETGR